VALVDAFGGVDVLLVAAARRTGRETLAALAAHVGPLARVAPRVRRRRRPRRERQVADRAREQLPNAKTISEETRSIRPSELAT